MNGRKQGVRSGVAQGFTSGHEDYRQCLDNEKEEQWYDAWVNGCKRIQAG